MPGQLLSQFLPCGGGWCRRAGCCIPVDGYLWGRDPLQPFVALFIHLQREVAAFVLDGISIIDFLVVIHAQCNKGI